MNTENCREKKIENKKDVAMAASKSISGKHNGIIISQSFFPPHEGVNEKKYGSKPQKTKMIGVMFPALTLNEIIKKERGSFKREKFGILKLFSGLLFGCTPSTHQKADPPTVHKMPFLKQKEEKRIRIVVVDVDIAKVVGSLIRTLLDDRDPNRRANAARELIELLTKHSKREIRTRPIRSALIKALADEVKSVRVAAANALTNKLIGAFGASMLVQSKPEHLPYLLLAAYVYPYNTPNVVKRCAKTILGYSQVPTFFQAIERLKNKNGLVLNMTRQLLIPKLIRAIKHKRRLVRVAPAFILKKIYRCQDKNTINSSLRSRKMNYHTKSVIGDVMRKCRISRSRKQRLKN
ncbi:MAG: HEAT repeat domain-containing protein [Pseudomonadota bacterium]